MDLYDVTSVEEAKKIIDANFKKKGSHETIDVKFGYERILYEDIVSKSNVPGFKRSTVDGYAVNSKDIQGASETIPAFLELKGEVLMGKAPKHSLELPGECLYVPTGGMLPKGSDAVVMIEYTDKLDENTILVNNPVAYGDNTVDIGEDVSIGETIIKKGSRLRPYEIGVLSSLGLSKINVFKKPKIGIVSTGDELVPTEKDPLPGQIRDVNSNLLYSSVIEDGGEPKIYGIINDNYSLLKETVERAVSECDIILISGGSSVGKKDQTFDVINSFDGKGVLIHGIAVKPGKPTIIGKAGTKIIFGLPGHPLACSVIYKVLVRYYMKNYLESSEIEYPYICKFGLNYHKAKGREEYLPVTLAEHEGEMIADPVFGKSGLISSFSKASGYIKIEKNLEGLKQGQIVYVYRF